EFPPSIRMSSLLSLGSRSAIVASTTAAGTISQIARGFCSLATNCSREAAPVAPSPESCITASALRSYATHWCPPLINRRTMFAPILPSPIIPSCIVSVLHEDFVRRAGESGQRLLHGFRELGEIALHILAKVHAQGAPAAFREHREIAAGLCCLDHTKRVLLSGHGQVHSIVAGNLEEHAAILAALVGLSRRVQETRAKAEAGGHFLGVTHLVANALQRALIPRVHGDVAQHGKIVARPDARQMRP